MNNLKYKLMNNKIYFKMINKYIKIILMLYNKIKQLINNYHIYYFKIKYKIMNKNQCFKLIKIILVK